LNNDDPEGYTPLCRYILSHKFDMAVKLLSRGADVNATNCVGKTALVVAIESENHPAVKFLVERQADPHIEDLQSLDACDYAARAEDAIAYRGMFDECLPGKRRSSNQTATKGLNSRTKGGQGVASRKPSSSCPY